MRDAVIVEAVRTPVGRGRPGGALHEEHPVDLLARTLVELVERAGIDPALVDDVIGGCVTQAGDQAANITRTAVLAAGFPQSVPGMTVDRQCGSSQQAAHIAAQGVMSGAYDIAVACGVESMSRVPMGAAVLPGTDPFAPLRRTRYPDGLVGQGISAELIAARWKISREEQDAYALESHRRAAATWERGGFDREVAWAGQRDETVRPGTSAEALAGLKPSRCRRHASSWNACGVHPREENQPRTRSNPDPEGAGCRATALFLTRAGTHQILELLECVRLLGRLVGTPA